MHFCECDNFYTYIDGDWHPSLCIFVENILLCIQFAPITFEIYTNYITFLNSPFIISAGFHIETAIETALIQWLSKAILFSIRVS